MNAIKTNYWKSIVPRRVPPFLIGEPFGSKRVSFLTRHFENCFQTFQSTTCFSFVSVRQWYSLRYKCSYCSSRWREGCVTNHVKGYRWRREKTRAREKKNVARESSNSYFSSTAISPITCNGLRNKEGSFYSMKFSNGSCQWWQL